MERREIIFVDSVRTGFGRIGGTTFIENLRY